MNMIFPMAKLLHRKIVNMSCYSKESGIFMKKFIHDQYNNEPSKHT